MAGRMRDENETPPARPNTTPVEIESSRHDEDWHDPSPTYSPTPVQAMPSSFALLSYRTLLVVCLAVGFAADAGSIHDDAPYQTPQFTPDVTHRTDLCERQVSMRSLPQCTTNITCIFICCIYLCTILKQRQFRSGEIEFLDVLRGLELS